MCVIDRDGHRRVIAVAAGHHKFASERQRVYTTGVLAEGVGFEPTLRFPVNTLSKRAPSATRPPLLIGPASGAAPVYIKCSMRAVALVTPTTV